MLTQHPRGEGLTLPGGSILSDGDHRRESITGKLPLPTPKG